PAGGWSATRGLSVLKDPRVKATQDELQKQFDLLVRIRDRVSAADDAVQQVRDVKEQIDAAAKRAKGLPAGKGAAIARAADSLQAKLGAVEEAIYQVKNKSNEDALNFPIKVNNKLASLAGVVGSADAPPTDRAYQVFDPLAAVPHGYSDRLKGVLEPEVAAVNRQVR